MWLRTRILSVFLAVALLAATTAAVLMVQVHTVVEAVPAASAEVEAVFHQTKLIVAGATALLILVPSVFGLWFARSVSRPIRSLAETVHDISRGEMDAEIEQDVKRRTDEIGVLAQGFDRTLTSLKLAMERTAPALEEEKERMEAELGHTESVLESVLAAARDGILVMDEDCNVTYHNNQFLELWNVPEDVAAQGDDALLEHAADRLVNREQVAEMVDDLYEHPEREYHDTLDLTDGRVLEVYSKPHHVDGEVAGRVWRFRDVTEEQDDDTDGGGVG